MENLKMKMLNKINSNPCEVQKVLENMNRYGKTFAIVSNGIYISSFRKTLKGATAHAERSLTQWYDDYTQEMTNNSNDVIEIKLDELTDYSTDIMAWYKFLLDNPKVAEYYTEMKYFFSNYVDFFTPTEEVVEYLTTEYNRMLEWFVPNKPTTTVTKDVKPASDTNTQGQQAEAVTMDQSSENSDKMDDVKDDVKVVYNEEKNGIELHFNGKPSEETRLILKTNGFRWSKYNKCWFVKDTNEARDFIQSFTGSGSDDAETITLESVNNDIQIVELENYTISPELSRRENDGNWIFRTKEVDHNSELQSLFNSILERVNAMLPNLSELEQLKLKRNFNYFVKSYHTNRVKELTLKANNPNCYVTGRSGRDMNKYNKAMERLNTIQRDGMKSYNIMIEKLEKYERKIKKAS